jgi:hypothetical protein
MNEIDILFDKTLDFSKFLGHFKTACSVAYSSNNKIEQLKLFKEFVDRRNSFVSAILNPDISEFLTSLK